MQKYFYTDKTQKAIQGKFGANQSIVGKSAHKFPVSAEREYIRFVNGYMAAIKETIEKELPNLKEEYLRQMDDSIREDGIFDFTSFLDNFFQKILDKLNAADAGQSMITNLYRFGAITKKAEIREWRRMVKQTIGVDLSQDYYSGDFFEEELEKWSSDNVDLIRTVPSDMLDKMKQTILEGYNRGIGAADIADSIRQDYDMSRNHARFIARDQMAKLSASITRKEHEDAGVTRYMWSDSGDERVRPGHSILNGKIFEYSNPPEIMEFRSTKHGSYWISTGRRCNPGEDYNCRCVAIPVFDKDTLALPLEDEQNEQVGRSTAPVVRQKRVAT